MRRIGRRIGLGLVAMATVWCAASAAWAQVRTVLASDVAGPTVLIVTDPAGAEITTRVAVEQVGAWKLTKGRVIATGVKELDAAVRSEKPDIVVVLDVTRSETTEANVRASGYDAKALAATLNGLKDEKGEEVESKADTAAIAAGVAKGVRLELVIKNKGSTVPAARARLFRHLVNEVLRAEAMTDSSPWTLVAPREGAIDVALYTGEGSSSTPGVLAYPRVLGPDGDVRFTYVGQRELREPGVLKQFDVVVFPGGMSRNQGGALGEDGLKAVREFIREGGGYVGSCAGAYLATSGFDWSLKLLAADVVDYRHWLRGTGPVDVELTDEGRKILGEYGTSAGGLIKVKYANGPLLGPAKNPEPGVTPFRVLAHFRSDMAKNVPGGVMPGTPAIIAGDFGKGRVLVFSPHPEYKEEYTEDLGGMIRRAVRWAARRD